MYGFLGFLFSYHYLLHMGFYSFSMSVSLFFWTLGYFVKHKSEISFRKIENIKVLDYSTKTENIDWFLDYSHFNEFAASKLGKILANDLLYILEK